MIVAQFSPMTYKKGELVSIRNLEALTVTGQFSNAAMSVSWWILKLTHAKNVMQAILICKQVASFEADQKRKGKVFYNDSNEYSRLKSDFLTEISQINTVANVIG